MSRRLLQSLSLLTLCGVLMLTAACTGLSGEPPVVATLPPVPTRVQTTDPLAQGEAIFRQRCAACHGVGGRGDGELVTGGQLSAVPDMTDPERREGVTVEDYYTIITEGRIENMMPPWKDALSDDERRAVAAYAFGLAHANGDAPDPALAQTAVIEGLIVNGTAGASVPAELPVTLYTLSTTGQRLDTQTQTAIDGQYRFESVVFQPDYAYLVSTDYAGVTFISGLGVGRELLADASTMQLPITVYETTDDPTVLSISLLLHQAALSSADSGPALLMVMRFTNPSDRVYLPARQLEDGRTRVLDIPLPAGAVPAGLDQSRYVWDEQAGIVSDTLAVLPGSGHLVHVPMVLPLAERWEVRYQLPYPVTNQPELMLPPGQFDVESAQFEAQGVMEFTGGVFEDFLAQPVAAGQDIAFTLRRASGGGANPQSLLGIGLIGVGLLSLAAAGVLAVRQRRAAPVRDEALIAQIAALDLAHQRGEIEAEAYQRQREALKQALARRMKG
jgi:mono/diheme cytochrome c family protein